MAAGGLYVIGTHRHESVRIDDQLRGRAGRQGDPGRSRFFVSLDDDLLRRYGIDRLLPRRLLEGDAAIADSPLDSAVVRREVARAQRIVDGESFDVRRRLYRYAEMLEGQRRYIAAWRQGVLDGSSDLDLLRRRSPERWEALADDVGADVLDAGRAPLDAAHARPRLEPVPGRPPGAARRGPSGDARRARSADRVHARRDPFVRAADRERGVGYRRRRSPRFRSRRDGVDWDAAGLRGPSATWTYLVSDQVFGPNVLRGLANRASIGLWGTLLLGPVLFAWGIYLHWRKRREMRRVR